MADLGVDDTMVPDGALVLGGSAFFGVPFPIAIGDRYIHLRLDAGEPVCQVWRWDPVTRTTTREPDPGERGAGLLLEPVGSDALQLSLAVDDDQLAGELAGDGVRVVCSPDSILVFRDGSGTPSVTLSNNLFHGGDVALRVSADGFTMGSRLPEGFDYRLDYVNRRIQIARMIHDPAQPVLQNVRFSHCSIEGPAVLFAADDRVQVQRCMWQMLGAPPEARFITLPVPQAPYGAIGLANVVIEDSDLVNVAFAQS